MNSLTTLYFPGTAINRPSQYPLYLLFQNIHVLAPVESDPAESGSELPDSFIKSGFCQVHTPCPLGKDRNRFLRLVEDIKTRKDDYAAQLSALTLAAMTGSPREQESERAIARSLVTGPEPPTTGQDREQAEKLWQARLILAIGELLDQEEEEITVNLAALEEEEKELFKELQGEEDKEDEDNPFTEFSRQQTRTRSISPGNARKRFQAWKTLYFAAEPKQFPVFLAHGQSDGDLLLDLYQQKSGQPAPLVARFTLPAFIGWQSEEACQTVADFIRKNDALLTAIKEHLEKLRQQPATPESPTEFNPHWEEGVASDFPEERFGRAAVSFYLFSGTPCSTLIGTAPDSSSVTGNGLLAVIE